MHRCEPNGWPAFWAITRRNVRGGRGEARPARCRQRRAEVEDTAHAVTVVSPDRLAPEDLAALQVDGAEGSPGRPCTRLRSDREDAASTPAQRGQGPGAGGADGRRVDAGRHGNGGDHLATD